MMKVFRILLRSITKLTFRKLWSLISLGLGHPLFMLLTYHATVKTFIIARQHYPETNSSNGKGNAFRHALWCCLIMMYCCKISSVKKSLDWCKRITDLYEDLFPNPSLETIMDKHNNRIGMDYFVSLVPTIHRQFFETSFFISELKKKTKEAVILADEFQPLDNRLVYLKEDDK